LADLLRGGSADFLSSSLPPFVFAGSVVGCETLEILAPNDANGSKQLGWDHGSSRDPFVRSLVSYAQFLRDHWDSQ
jgi:hypothetical protein